MTSVKPSRGRGVSKDNTANQAKGGLRRLTSKGGNNDRNDDREKRGRERGRRGMRVLGWGGGVGGAL